jgi:hypothetical protein
VSDLHSSLIPRGTPLPKTVRGFSRVDAKAARDAEEARAERECYAAVDVRDGLRCRVTGVQLTRGASLTKRAHRHHMEKRSQGGAHDTRNVITVSPKVHDDIHVRGILRLSGDADAVDERGRLAGVKVEELTEAGWAVTRWV